jgi:hypothetical protein
MVSRFSLLVFIFCIFRSFVWGQVGQEQNTHEAEVPPASETQEKTDTSNPFPLGPMLLTTLQGRVSWRPDWDVTMPPDAFRVSSGQPVSITLSLEEREYRIRWDKNGSLMEFPFLLQGQFVQVETLFEAPGIIKGFVIHAGSETPWKIDFIGGKDAPLSIARLNQGETFYFGALRYNPIYIAETWYDQEGNAQADFISLSQYTGEDIQLLTLESRYEGKEATEWYHYDGFGNMSEINGAGGLFSVLYAQEQCPRYWKRQVLDPASDQETAGPLQQYTLQWDERGFLVCISETSESNEDNKEDLSELRYEYTLDTRGNWIERREIRMIPRLGVLTSSPGLTVKRVISYGTGK